MPTYLPTAAVAPLPGGQPLDRPPTPETFGGRQAVPPTNSPPAAAVQSLADTPDPRPALGVAPAVPAGLVAQLQEAGYAVTAPAENETVLDTTTGRPLARWLYAAAVPFATVADETTLNEIQAAWQGQPTPFGPLLVSPSTAAAFTDVWGAPGPDLRIVVDGQLVEKLWAERPAWAIVPFDQLEPRLKVLAVDGQSPLAKTFDPGVYGLAVSFGLHGEGPEAGPLRADWLGPSTNRDPARLTRVAMSGVTALGRATAYQMEIRGITVPGIVVEPVFKAADIAHVSSEAPFAADCPYPNPIGEPIFCSRDSYLALLQSIGINLVELTGNHVNDWGPDNLVHSIELYEAAGMRFFGGGRGLAEAQQPALFEHQGNKIAFIGCNPVGPAGAWAMAERAGSAPCDFPTLYATIGKLAAEGYLVIATLQYWEFYHYQPTAQQQADFRALIEAGAAAVSGSQGHHAQGFDFHRGGFIHYGLGNLFFDQMDMLGTRQSFIDTYVIHDGRLLSVELYSSLIEDYCCPRQMTAEERASVLRAVFQASGW
jgi:hypothetical protein